MPKTINQFPGEPPGVRYQIFDGLVLQSTEDPSIRTEPINIEHRNKFGAHDELPLDTVARKMAQFGVHMYSPDAR